MHHYKVFIIKINFIVKNQSKEKLLNLANKEIHTLYQQIYNDADFFKLKNHNPQFITSQSSGHFLYLRHNAFTLTFQYFAKEVCNSEEDPYLFIGLFDDNYQNPKDPTSKDKTVAELRLSCKIGDGYAIIWYFGNDVYRLEEVFKDWKVMFLARVMKINN